MKKRYDEPIKTVCYSKLSDDFAETDIKAYRIDDSFPYRHGALWQAASFFLQEFVALPIVSLYCRLGMGLRLKNRRAISKLPHGQGFFLYGTHTHYEDGFISNLAALPRRTSILTSPDAVSIKGLSNIVQMLGAIPIPTGLSGMREFMDRIDHDIRSGRAVAIYPEAHIWPYCNFVRPFSDVSFRYPVKLGAPVVATVTTYRKALFFKRPLLTIYISDPIYPDMTLKPKDAQKKLRDEVYRFMQSHASDPSNVEYIRYEKESGNAAS